MTNIKGGPAKRGKQLSDAEFRRLWMNPDLMISEIGKMLGVSASAVGFRARTRGLPPRRGGGWRDAAASVEQILPMWKANVPSTEIGRAFGCTGSAITKRMRAAKIERPKPDRHNSVSLEAYRMAQAAAVTNGAMKLAEMVDHKPSRPKVAR